jgi:polyhydroxyalkanoate synthase subunit PhaC
MNNYLDELLKKMQIPEDGKAAWDYLEEFSRLFNDVIQQGLINQLKTGQFEAALPMADKWKEKLIGGASINPATLIEQQLELLRGHVDLWQQTMQGFLGQGESQQDVIQPRKGDPRFQAKEWEEHPFYRHIKQSYLLNARFIENIANDMDFKDPQLERQVKFMVRQWTNSLAPTNFISTNPEVCRAIIDSKGQNLYRGLQNFLKDLKRSPQGMLSVSMSNHDAFELGTNIATTPGKVVFENDLIQLLQYTPQTDTVFRTPILITPAFINKYYILDLTPQNSLIDWMVKQGLTVFVISWVNPDAELSDKTLTNYALEGPAKALEVIQQITGETNVNAIGYCIGGTLLAATQAMLKARGQSGFNSTTFFTALLDFSQPGEPGVYITDEMVELLEKDPLQQGVFDGRLAQLCFSLLRENNLYWSFFIHNYLLGKDPVPMDMLHWNGDSTNVPMKTAAFFLRHFYQNNGLTKPNSVSIDNTLIDLQRIDNPTYFLSTMSDHIAPWQGTYRGTQLLGGNKRFVLAGSGHIAGVINPPKKNRYGYFTNDQLLPTADAWFDNAKQNEGSWWTDWLQWITPLAGEKIAARTPGSVDFPVLEDAPGRYARTLITDLKTTISV